MPFIENSHVYFSTKFINYLNKLSQSDSTNFNFILNFHLKSYKSSIIFIFQFAQLGSSLDCKLVFLDQMLLLDLNQYLNSCTTDFWFDSNRNTDTIGTRLYSFKFRFQ